MTPSAWLMLAATFAVVSFFTLKFFLKVVRTPPGEADDPAEEVAPTPER